MCSHIGGLACLQCSLPLVYVECQLYYGQVHRLATLCVLLIAYCSSGHHAGPGSPFALLPGIHTQCQRICQMQTLVQRTLAKRVYISLPMWRFILTQMQLDVNV